MQNRLDYSLPPEALFLTPDEDAGLHPLAEPDFFWRARPRARILGFAASAHEEINRKIDSFLAYTARHKTFSRAVEFNAIPVALEGAQYKKSFVTAGGKGLLNGASGVRLLNRYLWVNQDAGFDAEARLADYFRRCQDRAVARPLTARASGTAGLPFAVEARNTFNYFHFVTETLCQFCALDQIGADRPLFLHHPNHPEKTRGFTRDFLRALFPEFGDRVQFERAPKSYDRVLTSLNLMNAYYQYGPDTVAPVDSLITSRTMWAGREAIRASQGVLQMNAVDSNLIRLRDRALRAIAGQDFSHLPRRFWVGREQGQARNRAMQGEDELLEMLRLFGFESVSFESLSPLEQVALMANAEVMVSYHGAGFTNMLFANPSAHVIEIGTLQTAMFRWGDFWRLANAAGCTYVSFFADFAKADPLTEPDFAEEGIVPVSLSRHGLAVIMSFLVALLGHLPRFSTAEPVLRLARQMNQIGAWTRTLQLFALHPGVEAGNAPLCLALAEAQRHAGNAPAELAALCAAQRPDPSRAFTLMQIVWCAQKAGQEETLRWALARMRADFPERLDEVLRSRPALRRLAV